MKLEFRDAEVLRIVMAGLEAKGYVPSDGANWFLKIKANSEGVLLIAEQQGG